MNLRVEVINCGVYGYNVNEESIRFAELIELLNPDIVLIGYELGDLLPNPVVNKAKTPVQASPEGGNTLIERRALIELVKESRVVSFLAYRYTFLLKKFSLRNWESLYADDSPLWKNLTERYDRMAAGAKSRNIDFAVAIIPELSNLDEHYPFTSVHERVAAMCRARGMKVVDLLPAFLGHDGPGLWIHPRDRHPNAEGHEIIAKALLAPLVGLVQARIPPGAGATTRPR